MRLVLGSRNPGKLRELSELLAPHELAPLAEGIELPPETGETFADNAIVKARASAQASGAPALGEDSGIVVAALDGAPGVRSARYAGEDASDADNLDKLLRAIDGAQDRAAAYVCALAFSGADGEVRLFEGTCDGVLVSEPRGSGGFGYDPIFVPLDGLDERTTMAELEPAAKNAISHRGRAARKLLEWLER